MTKGKPIDPEELSFMFAEIEDKVLPVEEEDIIVGDIIPIEGTPWAQRPEEPDRWYDLFVRYFLPLGIRRSVRQAYAAWAKHEAPHKLTPDGKIPYPATPTRWMEMATVHDWVERGRAFDQLMNRRILNSVELAFKILEDGAPDAAMALVEALGNARTKVQAANSILDRVGLPVHTKHESVSIKITPDDIRKAREDADEWEKKNFEQNG